MALMQGQRLSDTYYLEALMRRRWRFLRVRE